MAAPTRMSDMFRGLDERITNTSINENTKHEIIENVRDLKEAFRKQHIRESALDGDCSVITKIFMFARTSKDPELKLDLFIELFGLLRNMCAGCRHNQEQVARRDLFEVVFLCLEDVMMEESEIQPESRLDDKKSKCLRIGVQFLGNLVVNNEANKQLVWKSLKVHFRPLLQAKDSMLGQYCAMVLYNCLKSVPDHVSSLLNETEDAVAICEAMLQMLLAMEMEWSLYFVELMLQSNFFLKKVFSSLSEQHRLVVLDVLDDCLTRSQPSSPGFDIATDNITFLVQNLKQQSDCILQASCENLTKSLNPVEVLKILEVLCSASAMEHHRCILQTDCSLLIVVIHLLKSIHMIGKSGDNAFTPIEKLSEAVDPERSVVDNPTYGLKRDLVRLIGNMCWEHKENQDMVRELDGISLLLDCSKIDARNPFITQWVVFAIHNLCDGNAENQALIASMKPLEVEENCVLKEQELNAQLQDSYSRTNRNLEEEVVQNGLSCPASEADPRTLHLINSTSTASERAISDIQDLFM